MAEQPQRPLTDEEHEQFAKLVEPLHYLVAYGWARTPTELDRMQHPQPRLRDALRTIGDVALWLVTFVLLFLGVCVVITLLLPPEAAP